MHDKRRENFQSHDGIYRMDDRMLLLLLRKKKKKECKRCKRVFKYPFAHALSARAIPISMHGRFTIAFALDTKRSISDFFDSPHRTT